VDASTPGRRACRRIAERVFAPAALLLGFAACSSPSQEAQQHYERGVASLAKGGEDGLVEADKAFRAALEIKRTLGHAIYGLALVAEKQGKLREQFTYLNQAVIQDPGLFDAHVKIGNLLAAAGQLDKAQESCDRASSLRPNDPSIAILQAAIWLKRGERVKAVAMAREVLATAPDNVDALRFMAGERSMAGDPASALQYADRALGLRPDDVQLTMLKAQALEKGARLDEAEALIRQLMARHPENPAFREALMRFLVAHRRQDAAEAQLREIAARNPADGKAKLELVRFIAATRGIEPARAELEAYVERDPADHELKFALIGMLQARGDRTAAEALIRSVLARSPEGPDALRAKGLLAGYALAGADRASARALVDEILTRDERNAQALLLKATMDLDQGEPDRAIASLRLVLRDAPDSPRALMLTARAHELQAAPVLAEDYYARAHAAGKAEVAYGGAYAEFLMRRGQSARAEKLLAGMLAANPGSIPVLRLLAQARNNQGNWTGARLAIDEIRRQGG
jgi:predicted Zn-dependent protease